MFVVLKKALPTLRFQWFFSHVTSKSFIVLGLKFSFVIHFNFYYVIKLKVQSVATIEKRVFSLLSCLVVPVTLVRRPQWVSFQAIPLSTSVLPSSQHGQQPGSQTPSRLLIFMRRVPCISLLLFFFFRINLLNPKTSKQNYASDKDKQRLGLSSLKQSFLVCEHSVSVHSFATLSCKFSEYKPCTHFIKFILKFLYFMPPAQKIFNLKIVVACIYGWDFLYSLWFLQPE